MPKALEVFLRRIILAMGAIEMSSARANVELGLLDAEIGATSTRSWSRGPQR